jgi:high-affinity iron transporter
VSGANRELTEGVTALVSSAMLVYVGYWLHSRSTASAWQGFIKERVSAALAGGTLWAMALVSFLAVYREMFETVLFYQALWLQAGEDGQFAFLAGVGAAVVGLMAIAWAIFRYSARLPLTLFFTGTSILMCVLAVILAGKGVAALQEAGAVAADLVAIPAVPLLGIFPTVQGLAAQLGVALLVLAAFRLASRRSGAGSARRDLGR